jgi:chorismate lyase/3-hydroxybenzoate synthase
MPNRAFPNTSPAVRPAASPAPPAWVMQLLGPAKLRSGWETTDGIGMELLRGPDFALISARLPSLRTMPPADVRMLTSEAYTEIGRALHSLVKTGPHHPVRFWNHIPGVLDDAGDQQNRYMAFNAGRFAAFTTWYGDVDAFDHRVATATGVGNDGDDLIIHCLAARQPGIAVANPRQIAPHRYSRRYCPMPPCFARATRLERSGTLLVGGTASVVGEASVHIGDLPKQFAETMTNLAALTDAAFGATSSETKSLARYRSLRVYHPQRADRPALAAMLCDAMPAVGELEWIQTDLCRSELLVEIEGLATDSK